MQHLPAFLDETKADETHVSVYCGSVFTARKEKARRGIRRGGER